MRVRLSARAARDLRAIGDYIARDDRARAVRFVRRLYAKCLAIGDLPFGYPLVEGRQHQQVRRCGHSGYVILYTVTDDAVVILHIVHSARDYGDLL